MSARDPAPRAHRDVHVSTCPRTCIDFAVAAKNSQQRTPAELRPNTSRWPSNVQAGRCRRLHLRPRAGAQVPIQLSIEVHGHLDKEEEKKTSAVLSEGPTRPLASFQHPHQHPRRQVARSGPPVPCVWHCQVRRAQPAALWQEGGAKVWSPTPRDRQVRSLFARAGCGGGGGRA